VPGSGAFGFFERHLLFRQFGAVELARAFKLAASHASAFMTIFAGVCSHRSGLGALNRCSGRDTLTGIILDLLDQVVLVTGASRGIGATVAQQLAQRGADVVINYRSKGPRAERVAQTVTDLGRRAILAQADITVPADLSRMADDVRQAFGRLDVLVMNASGGLEKDKAADYAMQLNLHAQLALLDALLPLISAGGRVVFVTSHWAHFYGTQPVLPGYEPVAASKHAGEQALRARIQELAARSISLVVVSGDLIEGTITPKLLERKNIGVIEGRRQQAGALPTIEEFACAIVEAVAKRSRPSGHTTYVGSTDDAEILA